MKLGQWTHKESVYPYRVCHTEWSKLEREKYHALMHIYLESRKKCYRWTYLQSRNRVTDVENELTVIKGGVGWEELGDWDSHTHTHTHIYIHTHIILVLCIKEITIENPIV